MDVYNTIKRMALPISIMVWFSQILKMSISIISANLTAKIVNDASIGNVSLVIENSIILLSITLLIQIVYVIHNYIYKTMLSRVIHSSKIFIYKKLLSCPGYHLFSQKCGDILERVNDDFKTITEKITTLYPEFWVSVASIIIYFALIAYQNSLLSILILIISLLQLIPPFVVKKKLQINYDSNKQVEAQITDYIISGYKGFSVIKNYDLKEWWLNGLDKLNQKCFEFGKKAEATYTSESILVDLIDNILKYGTYIIVAILVLSKHLELYTGIIAISLSGPFYQAVKTQFSKLSGFAVAKAAKNRFVSIFPDYSVTKKSIVCNQIAFSDVSFEFEGKAILDNASFEIDCSKRTIIKGSNGAGKSTIMRLIVGLLMPTNGTVYIDNISTEELSYYNFPTDIFYLPQTDISINMSVKELIDLIFQNKTDQIYANLSQFKMDHNDFFDRNINDLSGGERKKVYLSIAFSLHPKVIMLDEPTNSLDSNGISRLREMICESSCGVIIITHESMLDEIADDITYLSKGGVDCE